MSPIREDFLGLAQLADPMLGDAAVTAAWERPSALATWSVGALVAHTVRAVTTVEGYLDGDEDLTQALLDGAADYYLRVLPVGDAASGVADGIRMRALASAARGHAAVMQDYRAALQDLTHRLPEEPADRTLSVIGGRRIALDHYLATRVVELTVHLDDLAVSLERPATPTGAEPVAIEVLVETARRRHGDLAVLRALARRERDDAMALRVL